MGIGEWLNGLQRSFWQGVLQSVNDRAVQDFVAGRTDQVQTEVTHGLRIAEKLQLEDPGTLQGIRDLVIERFEAGDLTRARELAGRWLTVVLDQLDRGNFFQGSLVHLQEILAIRNDYAEIVSPLRERVERLHDSAGREIELYSLLFLLSRLAFTAGRFADGEAPLREMVALWERLEGATGKEYVERLDELVGALTVNGHQREAVEIAERALEVLRQDKTVALDGIDEANRTLGIASLYLNALRDFARARELFLRAEELVKQAEEKAGLDPSPIGRWQRIMRLNTQYQVKIFDQFKKVKEIGQSWSAELAASLADDFDPQMTDLEMAECLLMLGQWSLQVSLQDDPSFLPSENEAEAFLPMLEYFEKLEEFEGEGSMPDDEQLLAMAETLDFALPTTDRNLDQFVTETSASSHQAVESLLRKAIERRSTVLGESHPETAYARFKLAQFLDKLGRVDEIEPLLRKVVADWREVLPEGHLYLAAGLLALAGLCGSTGRENEAWSLLAEMVAIEDRVIGNVFSFTSEEQRTAFLRNVRETYVRSLAVAWKIAPGSPEVTREAFSLVLRRKSLVKRAQVAQWESALSKHSPQLAELAEIRQQSAERLLAGEKPEESVELKRLTVRREQLEAELAHEASQAGLLDELSPVDLDHFSRSLSPDSVLLEFVRTPTRVKEIFSFQYGSDPHYLVFLLPGGDLNGLRMIDLGDSFSVDTAIHELRNAVHAGSRRLRELDEPDESSVPLEAVETTWIDAALIGPLKDDLSPTGEWESLLISPDDDLNLIPFEILRDGEGAHLIDRYTISYLSSGREALRFGMGLSGRSGQPMVVSGPDYNLGWETVPQSPDQGAFSILEHAPVEGEEIALLLHVEPSTGSAAIESELRKVHSPHILHLATHGFLFDREDRRPQRLRGIEDMDPLLQSGLALAGANTWLAGGQPPPEAGDGLLTAAEVASLDLLDTELVVLSACKTGLGAVRAGEGVQGLRRSFALAGARTLVMSLWEVPDQETRELMEAFYRYLKTMGRAEALKRAQLDLKEKGCSVMAWGAFICQGDPGPLLLPLDWSPSATAPPAPGPAA